MASQPGRLVVKRYPTIDWKPRKSAHVYVFDKLDGSNVRAEWTRKLGFWKFGRRKALLDHSNPFLLEFPDLIRAHWADDLGRIFREHRLQKATAFFEFWGDNSFAGDHQDEVHRCTLIDVSVHPFGLLEPRKFIKWFDGLAHAALLHHGGWNRELEEQVRSGTFPGMTFEGVVVKGGYVSPGRPMMFKVKNGDWFTRLRATYPNDADYKARK